MRSASRSSSRPAATWPSSGTKTPTKASRRARNGCRSCSPNIDQGGSGRLPRQPRIAGVRVVSDRAAYAVARGKYVVPICRVAVSAHPLLRDRQVLGPINRLATLVDQLLAGLARTGHAPMIRSPGIRTHRRTQGFAVCSRATRRSSSGATSSAWGSSTGSPSRSRVRSWWSVHPAAASRRWSAQVCCRD